MVIRLHRYFIRALSISITTLVVFFAGPTLIRSIGGEADTSYFSLAFANPDQAALGFSVDEPISIILHNSRPVWREIRWRATIDYRQVATGEMRIGPQDSRKLKLIPKITGRLNIAIIGTEIYIHSKIRKTS